MSNINDIRDMYPDEVAEPFCEALAASTALGYEDPLSVLDDLGSYIRSLGTLPLVIEDN